MKRTEINHLYNNFLSYINDDVVVCGWIKTIRDSKSIGFIELNDGSNFKNLQIVFQSDKLDNFKEISKYSVGSSIIVKGNIIVTENTKQPFELNATQIILEGDSPSDYVLQKKRHSLEFLRTITHLRPRTNTLSAVFRLRSMASFAIHQFFNNNGFFYVHTPIITASDCEGAGEMFKVTTLPLENIPMTNDKQVNYSEDFFGKMTSLTVSGQLEAECIAMSLGKVYTFGPTFRAENSNTTRHASEFWMIEPEMAFADLNDDMNLAQDLVKYVLNYILDNCESEIKFFNEYYDKELITRLSNIVNSDFVRITYTEAIDILIKSKNKFNYDVKWGCDLQTEHERYITEQIYKKPVFVTDYPKDIKSFYMRLNDDDKTVAAMDLLVPGVGEIIGGSQREERYDVLVSRIKESNLNINDYNWYLDLRKYGTVNHCGFGLGFERLVMYLTGINNIRDVIPFPRTKSIF